MPERIRRIAIPAFVILHFAALTLWILTPYSEIIARSPLADNPVGRWEQDFFEWLNRQNHGIGSALAQNYVDWIGAHQYWDFFAPSIPRVHRYLSVCAEIREIPERPRINCLEPLYQSFQGNRANAARPHQGEGSRSFRLVENLWRLNRPDLWDAFTSYWRAQRDPGPEHAFLLLHEFTLQAGTADFEGEDKLIWMTPD